MKIKTISGIVAVMMIAGMAGCGVPDTDVTMTESPSSAEVSPSPSASLLSSETPATAPEDEETPSSAAAATPLALTVTGLTLNYSNELVKISIVYPEISGMADAARQSGINEGVSVNMQDRADALEAKSLSDAAYGPHSAYFIDADLEVKRNDGTILSLLIRFDSYEGGADTASDAVFINLVNSNPARQLTLPDLFAGGSDYASVLNGKINALIAADPNAGEYSFTGVSADEWFYLTDTDLVIVFQKYAIAAGVYGSLEFSIPLADLSGVLIPGVA